MKYLEGQVAIVSGGLGDIGQAIVFELARQGADVAVGDVLEADRATEVLGQVKRLGQRGRYDRLDVSDAKAVQAWVLAVESELGTPTLIIPCAAIVTTASSRTLAPEQWRRELDVNLNGAFYLAQSGALHLLAGKKPGRIVFIGSWAAETPHPFITAYCVSKGGIRILSKCMALELARYGILVNEVSPGYVDGGLAKRWYDQNPAEREKDAELVPIRKLIKPEEVAIQVAHLCDPRNQHMTGSVLLMDGGLSLLSPASMANEEG
jgi:NAD(P)-dependent dehydrogenase (short-subunit alcohol dehydrogenase family)